MFLNLKTWSQNMEVWRLNNSCVLIMYSFRKCECGSLKNVVCVKSLSVLTHFPPLPIRIMLQGPTFIILQYCTFHVTFYIFCYITSSPVNVNQVKVNDKDNYNNMGNPSSCFWNSDKNKETSDLLRWAVSNTMNWCVFLNEHSRLCHCLHNSGCNFTGRKMWMGGYEWMWSHTQEVEFVSVSSV